MLLLLNSTDRFLVWCVWIICLTIPFGSQWVHSNAIELLKRNINDDQLHHNHNKLITTPENNRHRHVFSLGNILLPRFVGMWLLLDGAISYGGSNPSQISHSSFCGYYCRLSIFPTSGICYACQQLRLFDLFKHGRLRPRSKIKVFFLFCHTGSLPIISKQEYGSTPSILYYHYSKQFSICICLVDSIPSSICPSG